MPLHAINRNHKDFNALSDTKSFFYQFVKKKNQEQCEKLVEMSLNDDYTMKNLLDYLQWQSDHPSDFKTN